MNYTETGQLLYEIHNADTCEFVANPVDNCHSLLVQFFRLTARLYNESQRLKCVQNTELF